MRNLQRGSDPRGSARTTTILLACVLIGACSSSTHHTAVQPTTTASSTTTTSTSPAATTATTTTATKPAESTALPPRSTTTAPPTTSTTTTGASHAQLVAEPGCAPDGSQRSVRPVAFVLACGDGNARIEQAHWINWTNQNAHGTGVLVQNDCQPSCASGHFHNASVDLALTTPTPMNGYLVFSILTIQFHAHFPPYTGLTAAFHLV
jgi:hypothetical protein